MKPTIQRIIVPLDPSAYARSATLRACQVARSHDAELTGVAVLDSPGIRAQVAPLDTYHWTLVQETLRSARSDAEEKISSVLDEFSSLCREQGVRHRSFESEGVPAQVLLQASELHDLIVVGLRTFFHFETRDQPGDSLAKLLHRTATPLLAVPDTDPGRPIETVTVAYEGSMNAARTLREYAGFAQPLKHDITIFTAHENPQLGEGFARDAADYLTSHGLENCKTRVLHQKTLRAEDLRDTDLIVAGIHSKRFFQDLVVGSLTNELIERAHTPLFLSH